MNRECSSRVKMGRRGEREGVGRVSCRIPGWWWLVARGNERRCTCASRCNHFQLLSRAAMNAVTVARSFPRKNVIYGGGARVQRGRGKRERGRKIGERWRNDEDDRKGYASRPSRNSRREGR